MERVTKWIDENHVCYTICEKECPDGIYKDNPACMCTASKMAMKRLLEYEDTGLTPPEIMELAERDTAKKIEINAGIPICPVCGRRVVKCYDFCPDCGQRMEQ